MNQTVFVLFYSTSCRTSLNVIRTINNSSLKEYIRMIQIEQLQKIPKELKYVPSICYVDKYSGKINKVIGPSDINHFLRSLYEQINVPQQQKTQRSEDEIHHDIKNSLVKSVQFTKKVGAAKATLLNDMQSCPVYDLIPRTNDGKVQVFSMKDPSSKIIGNSSMFNSSHPLRSNK